MGMLLAHSIILAPSLGAQGGDAGSVHALRGTREAILFYQIYLTRVADRESPCQLVATFLDENCLAQLPFERWCKYLERSSRTRATR
ncbi:hypothetical protein FB593_1169 [Rhizobium sp. SJZ105]|nr:hypothetical protein FB593_1169 [Rhizobium sp. SJZ105]